MAGLVLNRCFFLVVVVVICVVQYVLYNWLVVEPGHPLAAATEAKLRSSSDSGDSGEPSTSIQTGNHGHAKSSGSMVGKDRIAVLLPYLGKSLPAWFDLFAFTASTSAELVDWFIFITEAPMRPVPANVHLVRLSRSDMFNRLVNLDEVYSNSSTGRTALQAYFQYIIDVHPYILVEIKPALGFLFADYAQGYSHWAYADLDLLVGRLHRQLTPQLLSRHDVITLTFGDNNRLYMRGQLTVHKNSAMVRGLWKDCDYLSHIGKRLERFFVDHKHWDFHSAEGCYSRVVADDARLSVLYVPIQFSDAFPGSLDMKETMMLGGALLRCYTHPVSDDIIKRSYTQEPWEERAGEQLALGRITASPLHCSYWIDPADQVCTEYVPPNATIRREKGVMTFSIDETYAEGHCREASIAHFQGWKREYFAYTARVPPSSSHAMVITDAGVIPLSLRNHAAAVRYAESHGAAVLHTGRLTSTDTALSPRMGGSLRTSRDTRSIESVPRLLSDLDSKGAAAANQKTPTDNSSEDRLATGYCLVFSEDLKRCTQPLFGDDILVIPASGRAGSSKPDNAATSVTLISIGWLSDFRRNEHDSVWSWSGPKVLVLAHTESAAEPLRQATAHLHDALVILVNVTGAARAPSPTDASSEVATSWMLPDKTLYNIGLDAAASDLVLLAPPGFRLSKHALPLDVDALQQGATVGVDDMLELMRQFASRHEHSASEEPLSPAIVFPVPSSKKISLDTYPSHQDGDGAGPERCGAEHPASLQLQLDLLLSGSEPPALSFNSHDLSLQRTLMLPVLFNVSASPHGAGFVRFPEELNGVGCFEALFLRVLAGSGYKLTWAADGSTMLAADMRPGGMARGMATLQGDPGNSSGLVRGGQVEYASRCKCSSPASAGKLRDIVSKINRYFLKAVELRRVGLASTYSRERFGITMERDQLKA